jgi:hypothetical protein
MDYKIKNSMMIFGLSILISIILAGAASASLSASTTTQKSYTDLNGNPIISANIGDNIYGVVNIVNDDTVSTAGLTECGVSNPSLTYQGTYYTSQDNGITWNLNDGSYDPSVNVWEYGDMNAGDSYLLKVLFQVTAPVDLTITDGEMFNVPPTEEILINTSSETITTMSISTATNLKANKRLKKAVKVNQWKKLKAKK